MNRISEPAVRAERDEKAARYGSTNAETVGHDISSRVQDFDWREIERQLDAYGWALLDGILSAEECRAIAALYDERGIFRKQIVMARHGFGSGEYKYYDYPLPGIISELRTHLHPRLAPIADRWNEAMGIDVRYPREHAAFIEAG